MLNHPCSDSFTWGMGEKGKLDEKDTLPQVLNLKKYFTNENICITFNLPIKIIDFTLLRLQDNWSTNTKADIYEYTFGVSKFEFEVATSKTEWLLFKGNNKQTGLK